MRVKRLYTFMLQTFLPVFAMTFFICLFIVLMQFLWRYIDDLVGKGLEISVIGELFFYAALTMVPMALPLAILLASLMTFGNLGEKFELTAMKAAGVSLMKTMRPLTLLMVGIAIGAFFFQNNVLPVAQTKMWTLLYSMRQKSPEMEIPEKVFYDQIPGLNLFVERKDQQTGMLYDLMIYDMSHGVDNTRIIVADSGRISMTEDKTHLLLNIYDGEQFENLRQQTAGVTSSNLPYRRESFDRKDILLMFDANFNRMDESTMRRQYVGKNIAELRSSIDSIDRRIDSIGAVYGRELVERPYFGIPHYVDTYQGHQLTERREQQPVAITEYLDIDSLLNRNENLTARAIASQALNKAVRARQDFEYKSYVMDDERKQVRRHGIELQKKFTLSFACIIFFFIGAPLGAIIRKGGIGLPLVVSVVLFIIYYIIDNTGYKMAREGHLEVVEGMWLSSAVLLPLGVFLTYKAVHDSAVFNLDAYKALINKLRGLHVRTLEPKEFTLVEVVPDVALQKIEAFEASLASIADNYSRMNIVKRRLAPIVMHPQVEATQAQMNELIDYLSNSRSHKVIAMLNEYPFDISLRKLGQLRELNSLLSDWFYKIKAQTH